MNAILSDASGEDKPKNADFFIRVKAASRPRAARRDYRKINLARSVSSIESRI